MTGINPNGALLSHHATVLADIEQVLAAPLPWGVLDGKTILVSGGAGFLPAAMVESLLHVSMRKGGPNLRIIVLCRNLERARSRLAAWHDEPKLQLIEHDVVRPFLTSGPIDIIIHAASQASPKFYGSDPIGTIGPNTWGTQNLLQLAVQKKASRFLYFSSSEVYGAPNASTEALDETAFGRLDCASVRACYAEGKRLGETLCVAYKHQHGVPAVIVRPFHTYGPGMRLDDGRVYADFVRDAVEGRQIALNSDGRAQRAFCYLSDATQAFLTVLLKGQTGMAYNVANPNAITSIGSLARLIGDMYPASGPVQFTKTAPFGYLPSTVQMNIPCIARIEGLGWTPTTPLADGFKRCIDLYLDLAKAFDKPQGSQCDYDGQSH
jgi:UDP-glucuronate decarboxylase